VARGPLRRFITATIIAVMILAGLVLSFQFDLGRPVLIFAGGVCVLDALARSLERYRRIAIATDLATWALAGLLAMFAGISWVHVGSISRIVVSLVICALLLLAYKSVALARNRIGDRDDE
jgi:peptidoglycan/LPS O-acetylase OafA/YrhL